MMRLPLAVDLLSRDGSVDKDGRIRNGFVSPEGEAIKRPGLVAGYETALGLSQGGMQFGNYLVYLVDDAIIGFDGWDLAWAYSVSTGLSLMFSSSSSYTTGEKVYAPDENGNIAPWFAVSPSSGVTPGYSASSYPYWSKYKDKPVGTHPSVSYTQTGSSTIGAFPPDITVNSQVTIKLQYATGGPVVFNVVNGYVHQYGTTPHWDADYVDYYVSGFLYNGYTNNYGAPGATSVTFTNSSYYLAAADYARSVLA